MPPGILVKPILVKTPNSASSASFLILLAGLFLFEAGHAATNEISWFPFQPATTQSPAEFDLRHLNERVAGDGGFIAAEGPSFIHSITRKPVRFWAVNGPSHDLKSPDDLRKAARLLAKYGVNMVRFHGGMFNAEGEVDPAKVRHAVNVVDAMKSEGIYTHFSIYFPLWLKPKPNNTWLPGYNGSQNPFAALFFNPDFQKQYQSWWKALLTATNASGQAVAADPAVFGLEILNEDSFFFWTFSDQNIPDIQLRLLENQFGAWVIKKHGSLDKALAAWGNVKTPRDRPSEGRLGFRRLWNMAAERTLRDQETAQFLFEVQTEFYRSSYQFLRGLGFRGVITASNWTTANAEVFGPLEKLSYAATDFIDRHGYFSCFHKGDNAEWSIREGHTYFDRSALRFDGQEPGKPKDFNHPVVDPSYQNKPSMISETTWNRPNRFRSEAPLFYAAYGSLQETDCIVHFALDGSQWSVKPGYFMQPWTLMSPTMMGQFPAAALIYRKSMIKPGATLASIRLNQNETLRLEGTPLLQDAAFDELRLKDVPTDNQFIPGKLVDPLIHFAGQTAVTIGPQPRKIELADLSQLIQRDQQKVVSSTGELELDYRDGILQINTPMAQGVSGMLKTRGRTALTDVQIESDMELGHIVCVSLDAQPLKNSKRMLLQVMSEEKSSGFEATSMENGLKKILKIGANPWLVKNLSGTISLQREDATELKVFELESSGAKGKLIGNSRKIQLSPSTVYYLVTAE